MSKFIIIGGARSGTGQATVRRFLAEGSSVVATVDPDVAEEASSIRQELAEVEWVDLDHGDLSEVQAFLSKFADIDGIAIAENYFYMEDPSEFDLAKWNKSIAVNLTLLKIVAHQARSWASCRFVIVLTSTEGFIGSFGAPAYAATKAAVHNLVKSLANTAVGGARYNAVAAGWIGGVMDTDEVFNMSRQITPLARLGTPEEVADVIYFLSTEAAAFINGATLTVDGGYGGVDTISKYEFKTEFGIE
jgi:NAD(P)-dependent dehydrogenase (short-subunit alcohol dehydrogenase family)